MKRALFAIVSLSLTLSSVQNAFGDTGHSVDTGTTAWMMICNALVLLMVPGLAMFYGGLVRTKNVIGTMMQSFAAMGLVGVLWVVYGYALSFGNSFLCGWMGWKADFFFLGGIDDTVLEAGVPEYLFAMFQGKFAIITPAILAGAFAERVSFRAYVLFTVAWFSFVYIPLCHWVWAEDGFLMKMGAIDFAGGTVVHISAGISGLVIAILVGRREGLSRVPMNPNNLVMTLMGAGLLWVGWFGFNAGSAISSGLDAARALTVTQTAAAAGALSWILVESFYTGRATALGIVSGILAGLVAITPAAGVVQPSGAIVLGLVSSIVCFMAIQLKERLGYDDTLDAFGIHGLGGMVGALLLVFFIRDSWWVDNPSVSVVSQFSVQAYAILITIVYAAVASCLIGVVLQRTIGMRLCVDEELKGLDKTQHAEQGYGFLNVE